MKKLFAINLNIFVFFCFSSFGANEFSVTIMNQDVADAIDTVCLLYANPKTGRPAYGGAERSIVRRKLSLGEVILVRDSVPISLLDGTAIYSARFNKEEYWSAEKIADWKNKAEASLARPKFSRKSGAKGKLELRGFVLSSDTLAPVGAAISFFDQNGKKIEALADSLSGQYAVSLSPGEYRYEARAEGFLISFGELKLVPGAPASRDLLLPRVKFSNRIILRNVSFDFNQAKLEPSSFRELDSLAAFLKDLPSMEVEISGHTDNKGSAKYNQALSEKRARAVVDYLIGKGIAKERLRYEGYGFTDPIAPNTLPDGSDNPSGRQENRRTEFKIIKI